MYLQLLGAAVVVGGAAALGFHYAARESARLLDLLELKKALLILSSEIDYMRTPLPTAAANIGKRTERWVGPFFSQFGEALGANDGETAYQLWARVLGQVDDAALTEEDVKVIDGFGKTLGYLDKQMQQNAIDYAVRYIDETAAALQVQAEKSKKMYRSLGVIGGLFLAVVLW
ncbi:MAG: stage III sporulation protein AB [Defluviitaleaceae bacterium]|nr:stage III sporulation protein AB [Defluviitaleaceae bacterium]